jgi:hypothetical protein
MNCYTQLSISLLLCMPFTGLFAQRLITVTELFLMVPDYEMAKFRSDWADPNERSAILKLEYSGDPEKECATIMDIPNSYLSIAYCNSGTRISSQLAVWRKPSSGEFILGMVNNDCGARAGICLTRKILFLSYSGKVWRDVTEEVLRGVNWKGRYVRFPRRGEPISISLSEKNPKTNQIREKERIRLAWKEGRFVKSGK